MLATMQRGGEVRPDLRRGRRPHRQEAGPRQSSGTFRTADVVGLDTMAHVIKTLQDNLNAETDPVLRQLRHARGAQDAAGAGQPGPEDQGRLLQEGRPRHPALRAGERGLRARRREGRRGLWPHAEEAGRRAPEAAAQRGRRAGPVPVGHPAQQLPLRRRAPGLHRRDRARRRLRDALGLRHEAGPVRAVAGGGLAAGGAVDPGRHRCRQGAVEGAAARVGVQGPGGRGRWRAHAAKARGTRPRGKFEPRRVLPVYSRQHVPRDRAGRRGGPRFETAGTTLHEDDAIRLWTLDDEVRDRQHQDQDARHQPRGVPRACSWRSRWPRRTTRAW